VFVVLLDPVKVVVVFTHWAARTAVPQLHSTLWVQFWEGSTWKQEHPAWKGTGGHAASPRKEEPPCESTGARHVVQVSGGQTQFWTPSPDVVFWKVHWQIEVSESGMQSQLGYWELNGHVQPGELAAVAVQIAEPTVVVTATGTKTSVVGVLVVTLVAGSRAVLFDVDVDKIVVLFVVEDDGTVVLFVVGAGDGPSDVARANSIARRVVIVVVPALLETSGVEEIVVLLITVPFPAGSVESLLVKVTKFVRVEACVCKAVDCEELVPVSKGLKCDFDAFGRLRWAYSKIAMSPKVSARTATKP
jgi:hypothetical protein